MFHAQAATGAAGAPDSDASQRFITGLRKIEFGSGRYPPGSLLLAQDPVDLNRHAPYLCNAYGCAPNSWGQSYAPSLCKHVQVCWLRDDACDWAALCHSISAALCLAGALYILLLA